MNDRKELYERAMVEKERKLQETVRQQLLTKDIVGAYASIVGANVEARQALEDAQMAEQR